MVQRSLFCEACNIERLLSKPRVLFFFIWWIVLVLIIPLSCPSLPNWPPVSDPALMSGEKLVLVYPCTPFDVGKVIARMNGSAVVHGEPSCSGKYRTSVYVLLYLSAVISRQQEAALRMAVHEQYRNCFQGVSVIVADLADDEEGYPMGVNFMFYRLFRRREVAAFRWMLWAEHDVFPVQPYWLDRLYEYASISSPKCWVRGSVYLGRMFDIHLARAAELESIYSWLPHINGNALWLLPQATDTDLRAYLRDLELHTARTVAFDVAFWQYIFLPAPDNWPRLQRFAHLYCYSYFIQNWFGTALNDSTLTGIAAKYPQTLLIHSDANSIQRANSIARSKNEFVADKVVANYLDQLGNILLMNASTCNERPTSVLFFHVPRTSSSALRFFGEWASTRHELLSMRSVWWADNTTQPMDATTCSWCPNNRTDFVFAGSFSPRLWHFLPVVAKVGTFASATVLREPLQRLVSHHRYLHKLGLTTLNLTDFAAQNQNAMHFHLGLGVPYSASQCFSDEDLRKHLLSRFSVLGLFEYPNETIAMFGALFSWPVRHIQHLALFGMQESVKRNSALYVADLPLPVQTYIKSLNRCDMQLYEIAKQIFHEQADRLPKYRSNQLRDLKISIFLRSQKEDADFAVRTVRSVGRYFQEHFELVLLCPPTDIDHFKSLLPNNMEIRLVGDRLRFNMSGHIRHKFNKLTADLHTSGNYILHLDSDVVLKEHFYREDFFALSRPYLEYTHYANLPDFAQLWRKGTSFSIGRRVEFEFSRVNNHIYPRAVYSQARNHVERLHGVSFEEYLSTRFGRLIDLPEYPRIRKGIPDETSYWRLFSDFNFLGAYLYYVEPQLMAWNLDFLLMRAVGVLQFNSRRVTSDLEKEHLLTLMDTALQRPLSCADLGPKLKVYMGDELIDKCLTEYNTTRTALESDYVWALKRAASAPPRVK